MTIDVQLLNVYGKVDRSKWFTPDGIRGYFSDSETDDHPRIMAMLNSLPKLADALDTLIAENERLTGTSAIQQGFYNAAMDRAEKAEREIGRAGWLAQIVIDRLDGTNDLPGWVALSARYYREALERADKAENLRVERHEYEAMKRDKEEALAQYSRVRAECEALRKGYAECIEDMQGWAAYASDYFKAKHDLEGDVRRHKAAIASKP